MQFFLTISLAALKQLKTFISQVLFSSQNNRYQQHIKNLCCSHQNNHIPSPSKNLKIDSTLYRYMKYFRFVIVNVTIVCTTAIFSKLKVLRHRFSVFVCRCLLHTTVICYHFCYYFHFVVCVCVKKALTFQPRPERTDAFKYGDFS